MEKDGYILPVGYKLKSDSRTYTIEKKLGQGGYGITYLAYFEKEVKVNVQGNLGDGFDEYTTQLIRVVCKEFYIKELSSREENTATVTFGSSTAQRQLIESFKQKMRKEAKFLSQLVHPNIARVSEVFEANNTVYIIMQYIRGESLLEKIRRLKHLSVQDAVRYITQICDAINEVHRNRILHLDIKPSNILFDLNDNVKLIDFGVSKQYNEKHEETSHSLLGQSAGFAPMEQYQQGGLTTFCPPTDIYALGATLYSVLAGKRPIEAPLRSQYDIEDLTDLNPRVSHLLNGVIMRAMEEKVKNRYQTVSEFKEAVLGALRNNEAELFREKNVKENNINGNGHLTDDPTITDINKGSKPLKSESIFKSKIAKIIAITACIIAGIFISLLFLRMPTGDNKDRDVELAGLDSVHWMRLSPRYHSEPIDTLKNTTPVETPNVASATKPKAPKTDDAWIAEYNSHYNKGKSYEKSKNYISAKSEYQKTLAVVPRSDGSGKRARLNTLINQMQNKIDEQELQKKRKLELSNTLNQANAAFAAKDWTKAFTLYKKVKELDPSNITGYTKFMEQGKTMKAINDGNCNERIVEHFKRAQALNNTEEIRRLINYCK